MKKSELTQFVKESALELGFQACGISKAEALEEDGKHLKKWLDNGFHAGMKYMENHFEKRIDPTKLVPGSLSVVSVILNYYPKENQPAEAPKISKYAYGEDYHFVLKRKLKSLFEKIQSVLPEHKLDGRLFVDSAPVLDRVWAQRAGLGWIGKHSLLINKQYGSYVFIGELILNIALDHDQSIPDYCGSCTRCIDACPTKAIVANKIVDSHKCISYQTIENKENNIDPSLKGQFENYIFGCDICQDVCPWNHKKSFTLEPAFTLSETLQQKTNWNTLSNEEFKELFKESPIMRSKYSGLMRNINFLKESI